MPSPIKIGLIGLGWVGTHRHLPILRTNPAFSCVGVADARPDRAQSYGQRYGLAWCDKTGPLAEIPWIHQVDALVIATPPDSHADLVEQALTLGKHVLTEKPFGLDLDALARCKSLAQASQRQLAIVHNFQFARSMQCLERDLAQGRLGAIRAVSGSQLSNPRRRLPKWYESLPLGLFFDESPHLLYLLRRMAGPLALDQVYCRRTPGLQTPAQLFAGFQTESGVAASLHMQFDAPVSEWFLQVHGEHGMGLVDLFRDIYLFLPNDGEHVTRTVLNTSLQATWQHWAQHLASGWHHLRGTLRYGNDEIYRRYANAIHSGQAPEDINADRAFEIAALQFEIVRASLKPPSQGAGASSHTTTTTTCRQQLTDQVADKRWLANTEVF